MSYDFSLSFLLFPEAPLSVGRRYFKSRVRQMMGNVAKRNQLSPEWGVKVNPNKQCWLVSGRYCLVYLHHRPQTVHGICLLKPEAKTSPLMLYDSQSHHQRKVNFSAKALMRWQIRPPRRLQEAETLMGLVSVGNCCRTAPPRLFFCGHQGDWTSAATGPLWQFTVTTNTTHSSELRLQKQS